MKKDVGIKVIGWLHIIGAVLWLIVPLFGIKYAVPFNLRWGLPNVSEHAVIIVVNIFVIVVAYFYLKQTNLGFWLMVTESAIFGGISGGMLIKYYNQPAYAGSFIVAVIASVIILIYTLIKRENFNENAESKKPD